MTPDATLRYAACCGLVILLAGYAQARDPDYTIFGILSNPNSARDTLKEQHLQMKSLVMNAPHLMDIETKEQHE